MIAVGEKIRIQRVIKNYTQEYMAFMLDISQAAYSNIERDTTEITLVRLYEIAEILEVSPLILIPKPKYGTGINQEYIMKLRAKAVQFWKSLFRRRKDSLQKFIDNPSQ
jgi:transcriptional regulator with XRE-family HTH domain